MTSPAPRHSSPLSRLVGALRHSKVWLRAAAITLAAVLGTGLVPVMSEAASTKTLTLKPYSSAWAAVGPTRTTSIGLTKITVPANAVEFGLQFRAAAKSSGYRTKVAIASNGAATGAFSRVKSYSQTALGKRVSLGFTAKKGDTIYLEGTVVAKKNVTLFLRAWKAGTAKPAKWQMTVKDSSSKRISKPGKTYLWARTPKGSPTVKLAYSASVSAYSAAKAGSIGVAAPKPAPTPTPTPTPPPTQTPTPTTPPVPSPSPTPTVPTTTGQPVTPDSDGVFSIAVIGDTQKEVHSDSDARFGNRTAWLAANEKALDLRYVLHTGDVVNWGWVDPPQYTRAKAAMAKLTGAGLPWSISVGNHETRAVGWNGVPGSTGYGGAAYQDNPECITRLGAAACKSWLLVRQTGEFNAAFPSSKLVGLGGTFEPGKADNHWSAFTAENTKWLVLNLEFAPRASAVAWAKNVVATHPNHNVIIQTHFYLNGTGTISSSNAGYGEMSPKYIYDEIVSKYPNVKIVTSGHTGTYNSRTDTNNGNTTLSFLGNDLGDANNPVRILTIDTKTGTVNNTVYSKTGPTGATKYTSGSGKITIIK